MHVAFFLYIFFKDLQEEESLIDLLGKERDKIKFHGLTFQKYYNGG